MREWALLGLSLSSCLLPAAEVRDDEPSAGAPSASAGGGGSHTSGGSGASAATRAGTTAAGGFTSSAGTTASGGKAANGGTAASGGTLSSSGSASDAGGGQAGKVGGSASAGSSGSSGMGGGSSNPCLATGLTWKSGSKTTFEAYPDPGSPVCVEFGCEWAGDFALCPEKKSKTWVQEHGVVAAFPAPGLERHDLCLKSGSKTIVVTVLDSCADQDCSGCCTANRGSADALLDVEKYTSERWGVADGPIQWADLGPSPDPCQ